jgi:hypothetical protein
MGDLENRRVRILYSTGKHLDSRFAEPFELKGEYDNLDKIKRSIMVILGQDHKLVSTNTDRSGQTLTFEEIPKESSSNDSFWLMYYCCTDEFGLPLIPRRYKHYRFEFL